MLPSRFMVSIFSVVLLGGAAGRATAFYELANADASPEHFSMAPAGQFAAVKDMRAKGIRMLAIWHSHPASPARMSEEDLRLAFTPDVIYVILSLAMSGAPDLRGFIVENNIALPAQVTIIQSTPSSKEKGTP